jgi:hypothetical protein
VPADHDHDRQAARQAGAERIAAALGDIADLLDRAHRDVVTLLRGAPLVDDGLEQARTQLAHLGSGIALISLRLRQLRRRYATSTSTGSGAGQPPA